jgi:two-component system, chemotaxis family, sensor kinase Cph1
MIQEQAPDITTCDREPIHIPGSIQPHGVLLSLDEPSLVVLQASANAGELFGTDLAGVLGARLHALIGEAEANALFEPANAAALERNPLYLGSLSLAGTRYGAIGHRYSGALLLELERTTGPDTVSFHSLYPPVRSFMARLQEVESVAELAQMAADEVQRITGFDRVLVYRFDADWHGHVIAETRKDEQFASYLDLWFPASDIPAQARELYRVNRLRLIADADYTPVPLVPALDPRTGAPLDLSYAGLRSVSPVHVEYLKNMGVVASMSISIIREGQLWGLISLHNKQPYVVPFEVRMACDFLGQAFSTHLTARENRAEYEHRLHLKSIVTRLLGYMAEEERFIDGLINHPDELLALGDAAGAAVLFEGRCALIGRTPAEPEVWRLADWLTTRGSEEVFHTDSLMAAMPDSETLRDTAAGVLAISVSKLYRSYLLWFRPETVQTVKWSGDPRKPVEPETDGSMRLHPRKSFEIWKETVRGRSLPWRPSEIESAAELRNAVVGVVLRKAEELAALSAELQRSNKELEAFSYSVSHDLRAPFRHIVGYVELLRDHFAPVMDETGSRFLSTISNAAESAGILVDNLLNFSRVGRAKLHVVNLDMARLVDEVRREMSTEDEDRRVVWTVADLPTVQGDPMLLRLVWQNLLDNALKYTRRCEQPRITIGCEEAEHETVFYVRDNGVGFKQQYAHKLFGVFQRLHAQEEFEGTGIGLANVRRIAGKHGGRTWAEGEVGKGATFFFSLPRRVHPERGSDA